MLQPDGQVVEPYEARFPDEVAWRTEMEKRAKARREAAAARKLKLVHPTPAKG